MTPGEVAKFLRRDLGAVVSDRTIRRWRSQAFLPPKKQFSRDDYNQILLIAQLIRESESVKVAQEKFLQILEERHAETAIDVCVKS